MSGRRFNMEEGRKLTRSRSNRMVGGVCAGIGDYFGVDSTIVRIAAALLILGAGIGLFAYIVCWIIIPEA